MIGKALRQAAGKLGLTVEEGVAYGEVHGVFISMDEQKKPARQQISICLGRQKPKEECTQTDSDGTPENLWAAKESIRIIKEHASDYGVYRIAGGGNPQTGGIGPEGIRVRPDGSFLHVAFDPKGNRTEHIEAFIGDILPLIAPAVSARRCAVCGRELAGDARILMTPDGVMPVDADCGQGIVDAASAHAKAAHRPGGNITGFIGALVGALLGAAVWAAVGVIGYVASVVGLLIAFLSSKGYDLLGGKPGRFKVFTLILCVILAVLIGNMGTVLYEVHAVYVEEVAKLADWQEPIAEVEFMKMILPDLMANPELAAEYWENVLVGLLFAVLGCFGMVKNELSGIRPPYRMLKGKA